jgi:hypothetical protein
VRRDRVLLFAAENSLAVVRQRLAGSAAATNTSLEALDIHVIIAPVVRLDIELDRTRLEDTVRTLRPVLLVLDPFVRLHRVDENASAHVAPLLDFLRGLQRRYKVARRPRASRTQGRLAHPRRAGAPRELGAARVGRLEALPPSQR